MRSDKAQSKAFREFLLSQFPGRTVDFGAIIEAVKGEFPEFCNDGVLCTHENPYRPEWQHRVRHVLDYLKNRQRVISQAKHGEYTFPII